MNEIKKGKTKKGKLLIEIFDTFFILIICFATLLSAMIMKSNAEGGIDYSVNIITFIITIACIVLYLCYLIFYSNKGLKETIKKSYDK